MFRNVPACSGMFHVPDFIDGQHSMAYHGMKPSFENETIDHFFLKADQHSADYGKASNLLFIWNHPRKKACTYGYFPAL